MDRKNNGCGGDKGLIYSSKLKVVVHTLMNTKCEKFNVYQFKKCCLIDIEQASKYPRLSHTVNNTNCLPPPPTHPRPPHHCILSTYVSHVPDDEQPLFSYIPLAVSCRVVPEKSVTAISPQRSGFSPRPVLQGGESDNRTGSQNHSTDAPYPFVH
jgi:hypothetical protein